MIFVLFIAIMTSGGEPERYQMKMDSMASCWKAAHDLMDTVTPDVVERGISVGCFQKRAGDPA